MDVAIGKSARWGRGDGPPIHLVVDVANRTVLACTGGAGADVARVPFDAVNEELTCAPCRAFWKKVVLAPNA